MAVEPGPSRPSPSDAGVASGVAAGPAAAGPGVRAGPAPGEPPGQGAPLPTQVTAPQAVVRVVHWRDGEVLELEGPAAIHHLTQDSTARHWIDLTDPSPALVAAIAGELGLHPLIAEDIAERNQRPKIELTDGLIHVVAFALGYEREVVTEEIDFVLGAGFLLTAHERVWDPRDVAHLREGAGPLLERGPDYLLWAFLDGIVDGYYPVFDRIGDEIDDLEDRIVQGPSKQTLDHLFTLKRQLIDIRHVAGPEREIFNQLTNRTLPLIAPDHVIYFRDVYDHAIHLSDEYDSFRDLVSGALDVYLSTVNNNLSLIMKRLTAITVILAGIGGFAGIFGMSEAGAAFGNNEQPGFWIVTGTIIGISVLIAAVLRRMDWI
jgi:magnesium transporter